MNAVLEMASLLINELHNLLNTFTRYMDINNHEEEYKVIFEIFYQVTYYKPFLLPNLHKDARFLNVLQYTKKCLDYINEVIYKHDVSAHALAQEMLRRAYMVLTEVPKNIPKYVIVCDGMSIIDAAYIVYRLRKEHEECMEPFVTTLINPGGITETYKLILEPYNYFQGVELTLDYIAHKIAKKIDAKDAVVFRGYDNTVHRLKAMCAADIINEMYELTSKLYNKITQLKSEFNGVIMVLSDHGYDVIEKGMGLYEVKHFWSPRSLSVIAPLLVI